jgi:threonylcarbamoyladenosine tRNA methylthiotransferase MtaB
MSMAAKRVSFKTLGCRLNQFETDALVTGFHNAGYTIVEYDQPADVTVINTCTVTNQSDQKSRNIINHTASHNPEGVLVVTGCMAENHRDKLEAREQITYLVDNNRKSQILSLIEGYFKGEVVHPDRLPGDVFAFDAVDKSLHTRTSIKIQDGCDNFCTFCIIPAVRGRAVSRPAEQIVENVKQVVDNGFREVVLTGVNIGRYDHDGLDFERVIEKVLDVPGDFRVRISSLEPDGFGARFHELFSHPKLAPHLHLCLQSGSERVLLNMRRMYTARYFRETVERFRKHIPDFNFTTDIIVGFPGESEKDFQDTLDLARELRFSHIHTFRYSRRKGTRADRMTDQVPEKVKAERSEIIRGISDQNKLEYFESMAGKTQRVLVEKVDENGMAHGYGEHYIPILFPSATAEKNKFETVLLKSIEGSQDAPTIPGGIRGEIV